jgi:hypothetical protein
MLYIRKVRTASGAIAIQVVRYQGQQVKNYETHWQRLAI